MHSIYKLMHIKNEATTYFLILKYLIKPKIYNIEKYLKKGWKPLQMETKSCVWKSTNNYSKTSWEYKSFGLDDLILQLLQVTTTYCKSEFNYCHWEEDKYTNESVFAKPTADSKRKSKNVPEHAKYMYCMTITGSLVMFMINFCSYGCYKTLWHCFPIICCKMQSAFFKRKCQMLNEWYLVYKIRVVLVFSGKSEVRLRSCQSKSLVYSASPSCSTGFCRSVFSQGHCMLIIIVRYINLFFSNCVFFPSQFIDCIITDLKGGCDLTFKYMSIHLCTLF